MADKYIDYMECVEYGRHFMREGQSLVGASDLVNMEPLIGRVATAVTSVENELGKIGIKASELRGGRTSITTAVVLSRTGVRSFFHHLRSNQATASFDFEAFFPKRVLGRVSRLKPADLLGKLDEVLRGFAAPGNATLPGRAEWQERLTEARDGLDAAVAGKGSAQMQSITASAGLAAARRAFLTAYNGTAKRMIRGLLNDLGRSRELKLFFLDLQVNESRSPRNADNPDDPDTPDETGDADTGSANILDDTAGAATDQAAEPAQPDSTIAG